MRLVAIVLLMFVVACGSRDEAGRPEDGSNRLADISLPDLSAVDGPVQVQIKDRHAAVTRMLGSGTGGRDLGQAFGDYAMVLHAAEYYDAAEPAYLNAQRLMPDDPRWPYYLGHLYRTVGQIEQALASYRRALELRPDDVATLVWLGRMNLDQGDPDGAEPFFQKAQSLAPREIAVQAGLGQVALAKKDYPRAAQLLESALAINPSVASIYSPLAMAYRGMGQPEKAEAFATMWRNTELPVPDPLRAELEMSLQSGLSFELRGVRALDGGDYAGAANLFRQGLALAPAGTALHRSLRHKLGTALALSGDTAGAVREFEGTVKEAPRGAFDEPAAKASYSLGVLNAGSGRTAAAIDHLNAALRFNPNYFEARIALADVLRGAGRTESSLTQYAEAVRLNPRSAEARFGYAMALVRLRRYADARRSLEESVAAQPDRPELANALARLLAAAPDAAVRDGRRALTLIQQVANSTRNTDVGETMAMALAEVGSFSDAAAVQRDVLAAARQAGLEADVRRMAANLRLYETGRPCRTPWPEDHPALASVLQ